MNPQSTTLCIRSLKGISMTYVFNCIGEVQDPKSTIDVSTTVVLEAPSKKLAEKKMETFISKRLSTQKVRRKLFPIHWYGVAGVRVKRVPLIITIREWVAPKLFRERKRNNPDPQGAGCGSEDF